MERRLGRGLGTLLGKSDADEAKSASAELPVERIHPNPFQPRRTFDDAALQELAESLRRHGVLQPVVVRPSGAGFELIAGERRWRAAAIARLTTIPALIRPAVSDAEMLELALVENVQRQDLDAVERALGYRQMMDKLGLTQEQVAERVGLRRSTVANHLRLLDLPEVVQSAIAKGLVSMGHARALLALASPDDQRKWMERVVRDDLSVRQVEQLVRVVPRPAGAKMAARPKSTDAAWISAVEERLRRRFGTKVSIVPSAAPGFRGEIRIDYFGKDELERILEILAPTERL